MAAVLFYLEGKENDLVEQDIGNRIGKLVEEADVTIIKDFLIDILKNDEKLLNRFKSKLQCDISPTDMKRYKNQVNSILGDMQDIMILLIIKMPGLSYQNLKRF